MKGKETFHKWTGKLFKKGDSNQRINSGGTTMEEMLKMAESSHELKMVVTPIAGNLLFEALPQILRKLPPDATAQIMFAMSDNFQMDEETAGIAQEINTILEERNKRETEENAVCEEDLKDLDLQLRTESDLDNLAVFIQDPKNPRQYWLRKIAIEKGNMLMGKEEEAISCVGMAIYDLGECNYRPCPAEVLEKAVAVIIEEELKLSKNENPALREAQTAVGIVKYNGNKEFTVNQILNLTAVKYARMQQEK